MQSVVGGVEIMRVGVGVRRVMVGEVGVRGVGRVGVG